MNATCPLCATLSPLFFQNADTYYRCGVCRGIFVDENNRPNLETEKSRYEIHENDVEDKNYQKFVSPITSSILRDFKKESKGLDFGAGTGPVLSKVLQDSSYFIKQYDPFFHNYPKLLKEKYDYIGSCEVVEHFYNPYKEFKLLKSMLDPHAKLYLMTEVYNDDIDFASWYYKNDPTHVFFYHKNTFEWIKNEFDFLDVSVEGRLITFTN
ncbi:MAG: methyltransferase domain-containing protein [Campylobacterota bacterium]|nr:methyltransferase domain-containing protein [Campylobacterota bacterium]